MASRAPVAKRRWKSGSDAWWPILGGQPAVSVTNRRRLNAALAKVTKQSTFGKPRNLIFRSHAMDFSPLNAGPIRGHVCWLIGLPRVASSGRRSRCRPTV